MGQKKTNIEVKREKPAATPAAGMRSNPVAALRNEIDRLFEDFAGPDLWRPLQRQMGWVDPLRTWSALAVSPSMDLVERDGEYEVQAELPGLSNEDIEVKLSDDVLTIRGEKSAEHKEDNENFHLQERSYGSFQRSIGLPKGIDANKIEAKFEKGVLTVRLPKSAEAKAKERTITVKAA